MFHECLGVSPGEVSLNWDPFDCHPPLEKGLLAGPSELGLFEAKASWKTLEAVGMT